MTMKGLMEGPGDTVVSRVVQLLETTKKDRKTEHISLTKQHMQR